MGVAMGTPLAPTLANIFMTNLEEHFLQTQQHQPLVYKRYIDDIFIIWTHGTEKFNSFIQEYNQFHPTIKFEHTISDTSIDYLDLTIYKNTKFTTTGKLDIKTHIKATNTFQYIHHTSHHPPTTKQSVLKSELQRYKSQCTLQRDYELLKKEYIQHFLARGYPYKTIMKAIKDTESQNTRKPTTETNTQVYPFIIEYDQRQNHPKQYICMNTDILLQNISASRLHKNRPIIAYKNKKNIGKLCTKSPLQPDIIKQNITPSDKEYHLPQLITKCGQRNCGTCPFIYTKNSIQSTTHKELA